MPHGMYPRYPFVKVICIFALLFFPALSFADLDKHAICSGAAKCLSLSLPNCSESDKKPNPDLDYGPKICEPFAQLVARGIDPRSDIAAQMFTYLGGEYRVTYEINGKLPVNVEMMRYLFDHMPFTSNLINAYQKSNYTLAYTYGDKWNFYGDNGRHLSGGFSWLREDSAGQKAGLRNTFWGQGAAKVLMWKLYGVALVFLDYDAIDQNSVNYRLRAIVFPANAFLNSVMKMDMFRDVVMDKMKLIIGDVENSAHTFATGERRPLLTYEKFQNTPWLKEQLFEFEGVVKKSGYGQKVWPIPAPSSASAPHSKASASSPAASKLWSPPQESSSSNGSSNLTTSPMLTPAPAKQDEQPPMILLPQP